MRTLIGILVMLAGAIALAFGDPALAQSCSTDSQCGPSAGGYNICLGDTLILRRRICVGGQCVEQEMGRMNCGGGSIGGTCQGNVFVGGGGNRCDAMSGRCLQGSATRQTCTQSCTCVGHTLTVSSGICSPGIGCGRTTVVCKVGCTCSGEPRCTDEPTKGPQRSSTSGGTKEGVTAKPAPKVNVLPSRMAEPFDPDAPRAAAEPPPEAKAAKTTRVKSKRKRRSR